MREFLAGHFTVDSVAAALFRLARPNGLIVRPRASTQRKKLMASGCWYRPTWKLASNVDIRYMPPPNGQELWKDIGQTARAGRLPKVSTETVDNSVYNLADSRLFVGLKVQWAITAHFLGFLNFL